MVADDLYSRDHNITGAYPPAVRRTDVSVAVQFENRAPVVVVTIRYPLCRKDGGLSGRSALYFFLVDPRLRSLKS